MRTFLSTIVFLLSLCALSQGTSLQAYTPSVLFNQGDWEFKSFQNVYTQTKSFGSGGEKVTNNIGRQTWITSINQFLYGISPKVNIGFDVWLKNANYELAGVASRTAIVGVGPKVKIAPFSSIRKLSLQSTLLVPLADDLEGRPNHNEVFLHNDGTVWLSQIFYDHPVNDNFQLFFQQAFWYNLVGNSFRTNNYLQTQTSLFLSFFPTTKWTVYGMTEYFPTHYNDSEQQGEAFFSYFVQSGLGLKYQLIANFIELEFLYTNFWSGSEGQGAGETFNLGIRVIRQR